MKSSKAQIHAKIHKIPRVQFCENRKLTSYSGIVVFQALVHSFRTLLNHMSTITRDECVQKINGKQCNSFHVDTKPNPKQKMIYRLLDQVKV